MFYIVTAGLLITLLAVTLIALRAAPTPEIRHGVKALAVLLIAALFVLTAITSVAKVGAREVGIETAFGRYSRTLDAGWQIKAPWAAVETFSTRLQRSEVDAPIAFAGGGSGTQHATVQWAITDAKAQELWQRYQKFENVDAMLVQPATREAIGAVMAKYTPAEARAEQNVTNIRVEIVKILAARLAPYGVELDSVALPPAALDQTAQDALNRVVEAAANVQRAEARREQAKIDAEADAARNKNLTDENLTLECLTLTNNWNADKNGPLPATWNCFGNAEASGVIVGGK